MSNLEVFIKRGLSLAFLAFSFFAASAFSADPPVLITDLILWSGGEVEANSVNVLLTDGRIIAVSNTPIDVDAHTIVLDGGRRVVMGNIIVGEPANLLVVEGNPADDITVLAAPDAHFLIVRNGVIQESIALEVADTPEAEPSKYRALDPARFKVVTLPQKPWYVYNNDGFSIAFGGGVLMDRTSYHQDSDGRDQFGSLSEFNTGEVRAARLGLGGGFLLSGNLWKYTLVGANRAFDRGFDTTDDEEWTWYDWALGIPVYGGAELKIGKQKENFSHDRLTILVDQPFMERAAELDTLLPSRNTGITLANNALNGRMTWSLGYFTNMLGDRDEPFEDSNQYATRVTALPIMSADGHSIVHLGAGYRHSDVDSHTLHFRGKPETHFGPDFIDTEPFSAESATWQSLEAGWLQGPFWLMGEYVRISAKSRQYNDPDLSGYHVTGAWAITGERRGYDQKKGVFTKLLPGREVIHGGAGAWEAMLRYSKVDLNDGLIEGGEMSRSSVGLNWYPTSTFKTTLQYGWVDLDRFGLSSTTEIFQFRMAFLLGM